MAGTARSLIIGLILALGASQAHAQEVAPPTTGPTGPLYDPRQLPIFHGRLELFTLTPRGDIDGFVMADGTEVKTPPYLTDEMDADFRPGDIVTIHGLKAASLSLIQAMSVTNETSGRTVVDAGPDASGRPDVQRRDETAAGATSVLSGRIRMDLHGPRGDVNGVLLEDGSILKLPPPEAVRLSTLLAPGKVIAAEGMRRTSRVGAVVELTAVGPVGGPLTRIGSGQRSGGPDDG